MGPLDSMSRFYSILFAVFIFMNLFAVLNVVNGIFVDVAMESGGQERYIMMEKQRKFKEETVANLREMFEEFDQDAAGTITEDDLVTFLEDNRVAGYLEALKLDTSDAMHFFKLLDPMNSKMIAIDDFIDGCMRLHGQAKSMDLHTLMYDTRRIEGKLDSLVQWSVGLTLALDLLDGGEDQEATCPTDAIDPVTAV